MRAPLAVLVLTVVLHAAVGVLVTCHVVADPRSDGIERVALALPGSATCPDCADGAGEPGVRGPADVVDGPDLPCRHPATHASAADEPTARAPGSAVPTPRAVLPPSVVSSDTGAGSTPACPAGPVPSPAVREPVAVLGVDRN